MRSFCRVVLVGSVAIIEIGFVYCGIVSDRFWRVVCDPLFEVEDCDRVCEVEYKVQFVFDQNLCDAEFFFDVEDVVCYVFGFFVVEVGGRFV